MFKLLLWKEWHEQRWKLLFGTALLLFFTGSFMAARVTSDQEMAIAIFLLGGTILTLYSAMGLFAPERENRTWLFLRSRPTWIWQICAAKWLLGWLNFAVPIALSVLLLGSRYLGEWRPGGSYLLKGTLASLGMLTVFYTLVLALTPRRASEALTGLSGLVIAGLIILHFSIVAIFIYKPLFSMQEDIIIPTGKQVFMFFNPLMWIDLVETLNHRALTNPFLMFSEQLIIFALALAWGWRKWRRA